MGRQREGDAARAIGQDRVADRAGEALLRLDRSGKIVSDREFHG
ncbi:hypothetical protein [Bifidobacterium longum]|nr:hypothetical protein [Bifidobacterium longum]